MGKGSKPEIEETAEQKELAAIAAERYDYFEKNLMPVRQVFIDEALDSNNAANYQKLAGTVQADAKTMLNDHLNGAEASMKSAGIDPTSGRYAAGVGEAAKSAAEITSDTVNRAQSQQQDNYVANLGNVIAMGEKKATQAIDGLSDVAAKSADHALQSVNSRLQRRDDVKTGLATVGTIGLDTALNGRKT